MFAWATAAADDDLSFRGGRDVRCSRVPGHTSVRRAGGGGRCLAGRSIVRERPAVLEPVPPLQRIDRSLRGLPDGGELLGQSIL